jgi:DNA-binding transcriptional LysR family regulator
MDFRQLESLVAIVKHGSFTKAAEELYLTQPTLTGHIQSLENELGTVLLNRCGKQVTLTEAGQILYKYAVDMLNTRELALYSLAHYEGKLEGELAIAASTVPQSHILPRLLAAFSQRYPHVVYRLNQQDSGGVVQAIASSSVDFGFVGTAVCSSELETVELCRAPLVIITPCGGKYGDHGGNSLTWDAVKGERFILREEGSGGRTIFLQALQEQGLGLKDLHVVATMESPDTIKQCVMAGLGIAVASELSIQEEVRLGLLKAFYLEGFDLTQRFYFVVHKNRVLCPVARAFQEFILESAASLQELRAQQR